ncbi:MAG: GHKL domain-containing protein [Alphaproteobacteria bacterium]|nr:GHKL domain-containing protein [Alphaproteobacteria bacterium]
MPDAALTVDEELRVAVSNARARALYPRAQPGASLRLSVRSPDLLDAISRTLESGESTRAEWRELVPVERAFDAYVSPLDAAAAKHAVIVIKDVSEAWRLERMRVDFVANASHELRTPLASVLGFIETLQGPARNDTAAREKFLVIMRDQARRMARLVDDLLSLSRIEQKLHVLPVDRVDLVEVVRHVADTLAPLARELGVLVHVTAPASASVTGDRDELLRVAENLIENAIKYGCEGAGENPRVDVSVTLSGEDACFAVRDHGEGIAAEHLPRLTERFYRVDAPASRTCGGTGLGLAIVKNIVARHRGSLKIASTPGEGSEFSVTIPIINP